MNSARLVGLRLYVCASGILSAHFAYVSPHIFQLGDDSGRTWSALLMLTTCIIGVLDTIINDVLGERWQLQWAQGWRNEGYIVLAVANLAMIYVAVSRGSEGEYLLRFALDAVAAVYVAFRDVHLRFVQPRKESRVHVDRHA